jgi:hypothetical protein
MRGVDEYCIRGMINYFLRLLIKNAIRICCAHRHEKTLRARDNAHDVSGDKDDVLKNQFDFQ